jgi:hypothetical protein
MFPLAGWLTWYFSAGNPTLGIGWIETPRVADLPATVWNFLSGYGGVPTIGTALFGVGTAIALSFSLLAGSKNKPQRRLALWGVVVPLLAVWIISYRRPVYIDRYFLLILPIVAALIGAGASVLWRRTQHSRSRRWLLGGIALVWLLSGLAAALEVHSHPKFAKEDWRGLVTYLQQVGAAPEQLWLPAPDVALPLAYYGAIDVQADFTGEILACSSSCWRILRQRYTSVHAFSQSVSEPNRDWPPRAPANCNAQARWNSPTNVSVELLDCLPSRSSPP